ncbi:MAG: polysaccharide ABC transporter ATP-binding protein [Flavobacteriales bacterium]
MPTAIHSEHLSKVYHLGEIGTGTLSRDLERWIARVRGKEDPFLRIGETNDRSVAGTSDVVYSLRDINFRIDQGESVGIIGKNGAGKSTLLKILSRVTSPSTGRIRIRGRVASLLEVGTGFHPELTGKENIYLNGAILGMRKREIDAKLDEIIAFSGVERYIGTPVKRYSSGMYVRLAFAVAAHLEPDILIVDEVLAVGDAEFQKKCLGKMKDVRGEGRTVIFVSHNMIAVKSLCSRGILLSNGMVSEDGEIESVVQAYTKATLNQSSRVIGQTVSGITLNSIEFTDNGNKGHFDIDNDLSIRIALQSEVHHELISINIFFNTPDGSLIFVACSPGMSIDPGEIDFKCTIPANTLNDNVYSLDVMVVERGEKALIYAKETIVLEGVEKKRQGAWLGKFPGLIRPMNYPWTIEKSVL